MKMGQIDPTEYQRLLLIQKTGSDLADNLLAFANYPEELDDETAKAWIESLGGSTDNVMANIVISSVREYLENKKKQDGRITSEQTSEYFVETAEKIEELAKKLSRISGVSASEILMIIAKLLEEEEEKNGTYN
jgi:hypothetical protein